MKFSSIATLGFFTALASASSDNSNHNLRLRHLHFPRSNATTTAGQAAATTLTVIATQVHTVIRCAPTVTNCPARNQTAIGNLPESAKTTMVITDTVVLTTTVCPVSEASQISSSLISEHKTGKITGSTVKPTTVTTALYPTPPASGASNAAAVTDQDSTTTTTVTSTTETTVTITRTRSNEGKPTGGNGGYKPEPTTTVTSTSTRTRTITIAKPSQTAAAIKPDGNSGSNGETCKAPKETVTVTVAKETVTVPASTVYVTIAPSSACSSNAAASPSVYGNAPDSKPGNGNGGYSSAQSDSQPQSTGKASPGNPTKGGSTTTSGVPDSTTTVQAIVTVQPYPLGNSTTSGHVKPSGFVKLYR